MSALSYDERADALRRDIERMPLDEFESTFGELIDMAIDFSKNTTDDYETHINVRIKYDDGIVNISDPWQVNPAKFQTPECNTPPNDAWEPGTYNRSISVPTRTEMDSTMDVKERMIDALSTEP